MHRGIRIGIIDEVHPVFQDILKEHELIYIPELDPVSVEQKLPDFDVLVMRSKLHLNASRIDCAKRLKLIGRLGSGMDNIDTNYAESKGINCLNAPEGNRDAVAEQCMGMILSLLHRIYRASNEVKLGHWDRKGNTGEELNALNVGIIGFGNVGQQLAKRLAPFGCNVLVYDRFVSGFNNDQIKEVSLPELMTDADIVSLHVPLNRYSEKMVSADFVAQMSKPFYLLNLSRGKVIDSRAVVDGLQSGKIKGLALDVFENENINSLSSDQQYCFDYLTQDPRVIFTPHIAGLTKNSFEKTARILANKISNKINSFPFVKSK